MCVSRPFAIKSGRRPVYLVSNTLMLLACIWLGLASTVSYIPFILGRAFLGIFEAPIESIVPSTISDIFYLHERGEKVDYYGLSVLSGNELGPVISAPIIQHLGMEWAFYIVAIVVAGSLGCMVVGMPETRFGGSRPDVTRMGGDGGEEVGGKGEGVERVEDVRTLDREDQHSGLDPTRRYTYLQKLLPWQGRGDPPVNLLHAFLRPFVITIYPTILWSSIIYGLALSWIRNYGLRRGVDVRSAVR
jgi:MFS family permease